MYIALMCLLTVFSGWVLWHRNPLFSVRATLRFIVVLTAMIGAFVLAELAAIKWTEHRSQAVQLGTIFGVVGVGTLVMIAVAVTVSLPKATPLPPTAKRVVIFRSKIFRWAKRFGWGFAAFALLELVLRGPSRDIVGAIGGLFAFMGIVMLLGAYLTARRSDLWLSSVEASPWVHWTYTTEQWQRWVGIEVQRATPAPAEQFHWRRDWKKVLPVAAALLVTPLLFVSESWTLRMGFVAVIGAMLVAGVALLIEEERRAPHALHKKLDRAVPEVYFGQEGLFANGDFTPWLSAGGYLEAASIDTREPRSMTLQFQKIVAGAGSMQQVVTKVNLPVPDQEGVAQDLARLQRELSTRCSRASVSLA